MVLKIKNGSLLNPSLLCAAFFLSFYVSADPLPAVVTPPMPLNTTPQQDVPPSAQPEIQPRFQTNGDRNQKPDAVPITDDDLKKNLKLTESILNQAMLGEDWQTIVSIMKFYPEMPGRDVILQGYIEGALARHRGDYKTAISAYQEIIDNHPDLDYVKLEMATAMFDNRQYADAEKILKKLAATPLDIAAQRDIYIYRRAIARQNEWRFHVNAGRVFDNNINSANGDEYLYLPQHPVYIIDGKISVSDEIIWIPFGKDRGSKPYRGWGTLYGFSADREKNIHGNNNVTFSVAVNGKLFDRYKAYNDNTLSLSSGYKYQNIRHWLSVAPQINKRWIGSASYSTTIGLGFEYGYRPSNAWQLSVSETYSERRYAPKQYGGYDGHFNIIAAQAVYSFNEDLLVLGSVNYIREITREKAYGSHYPYATLAVYGKLKDWIAGNSSVTYGKQFYSAPYPVFANMNRQDRQFSVNTSLWKPGFNLMGMSPKLNVSYQWVNSSIRPYGRNQSQLALIFSRDF